jgi:adenylate cyclase
MKSEKFQRKLTAIFSADVEGYSRLMRDDEDETIHTITAYRKAITILVQKYRGRVVDSPGDNILAEFGSVIDAVNCAVEVQRELAERNETLPESRRMRFRIGVNSGDVVEEGERIYGDGVNIAARIESLAEGGGISISGTVYDSIEGKLGLEFEFLGEHNVKNIDKSIRVYRVLSFPGAAAHRVIKAKKFIKKKWRRLIYAIAITFVLIAAAALIWNSYFRLPQIDKIEKERPELVEGPAIAVLPFVNTNGKSEDEYICDGITENIIAGLSQCPHLLVISSNSVFTYKGKPVNIRKVGRELGAKFVVEGSVQLSKKNVRITVQIINATNDHHVWSKKYDRILDDIFYLQDEITLDIILAFQIK